MNSKKFPRERNEANVPLTADEIDLMRQSISKCFDPSSLESYAEADKFYAVINFKLAKDGSLSGFPSVYSRGPGASGELAVIARKAVVECSPYDKLPRDKYQTWKDVTARFTVSGMM